MPRPLLPRCALATAVALTLSACVTTAPQVESAAPVPQEIAKAADDSSKKVVASKTASKNTKSSNKSSNKADKNAKKAATPAADSSPPENNLLSGKTMSGRELLTELRGLRSGFSSNNPMQALNQLFVPATASATPAKNAARTGSQPAPELNALANMFNSQGGMGSSAASLIGDIALDLLITEMSYSAIDQFFGQMIDDKDVLAKVSVEVPEMSKLSPSLRKQVLNLSAYLAAIKASGLMIDSSQGEFDAAKASYLRAVDIRKHAVELLGAALHARAGLEESRREGKKRGSNFLTDPAHSTLLEAFKDKKPEELLNDFAAQNAALAYLQKEQPELFKDYRVQVQDLKSHYGAYVKTVAGTTSMLGFSALFLKKTKQLIEREKAAGALALLPLASQGLSELAALAPRVKKTFDSGDDMSEGSFKIKLEGSDKAVKAQLNAKKALAALDSEAQTQFKNRLLNSQGEGLLYALYKRSPKHAGMLLDRLSSKDSRSALVKDYLQLENAAEFSFQNVYEDRLRLNKAQKRGLTTELLGSPLQSAQPDPGDLALLKVQQDIRNNLGNYSNSDLRKLIFAVPQQKASNPSLNLGKMEIQIDALGVAGLAEYDEVAGSSLAQATTRSYRKENTDKKNTDKKKVLSSL